jgi:hypothetical protein
LSVRAKVNIIKFDKQGYTEALGKAVQVQIRQAAREWLRAVILKVPVYTGMAKGSLLPLGRYLRVAIPIVPDPIAQKRFGRGPQDGESLGLFDFKQINQYVWQFQYATEVQHYLINEFTIGLGSPPLRNPTPWHSFEAGKEAWDQYLQENLKSKIPKISSYISTVEING